LFLLAAAAAGLTQTVWIDASAGGRRQVIDGFGTCLSGGEGFVAWWQALYFDDLQCSILRMDLTPKFKAPYNGVNGTYNSPWFHNNPPLPGPENNNVRTYTNAADYTRLYNGWRAPIAVMGTNINQNTNFFDYNQTLPRVAGALAQLGQAKASQLGGFKLIGSLWSPAPWLKIASGNRCPDYGWPLPVGGTPWPFIWYDNFAGGRLDTSGTPRAEFDDGTGPTSALTQFARCTAAYLRGFQQIHKVRFYAISLQNELNFEEFYNSCTYPLSAGYLAALKALRTELDRYPDLAEIRIMGPEDLLGGDAYGLWQYGGGSTTIHKNLQYLQNLGADPEASAALDFFCIHGYASDGVSAASATPGLWHWWANGWSASPAPGIPSNVKGFTGYGRKSWMTETSGETPVWLAPASGFPGAGAWSLALRIHQALTTGQQSAWVYWQLTDGNATSASTLTSASEGANAPKYAAAKHYFRYIRPGAVRVEATVSGATNLLAAAFVHDTHRTITVVMLNTSPDSQNATVQLPSEPGPFVGIRAFISSDSGYWQPVPAPITSSSVAVTLPGYGVLTLYAVAAPTLSFRLEDAGKLTLSWTPAAPGFVLQSRTNLSDGADWSNEAASPTVVDGLASVTLTLETGWRFFRLALP
jgi:O-glycosyl hydrolase